VSFDEAIQTCSETVPATENPSWKYIVSISECMGQRSKVVTSLVHSLVQTAAFYVSSVGGDLLGHEEATLPPMGIETTDAECISKSLVYSWEQRLFGGPVDKWLASLTPWVGLLVVVVAADSAGSNILALSYLCAQFLLCGVLTLFWWKPCNLHQLMRSAVVISKHADLQPSIKSMSKVLRLRKTRKRFEDRVINVWKSKFRHNDVRLSPEQLSAAANIARKVGILLTHKRSATDFHTGLERQKVEEQARKEAARRHAAGAADVGPGATQSDASGAAEQPGPVAEADLGASDAGSQWVQVLLRGICLDELDEAGKSVWAYLIFLNNCSPCAPAPGRFKSTESKATAVADGAALLRRACFSSGVAQYNEARLLRYIESAHFWSKLYLLVPNMDEVWATFQIDDDARARAKQSQLREVDRARVTRIRKFHAKPEYRSLFTIWYGTLAHMESLVQLFFYLSTDISVCADYQKISASVTASNRLKGGCKFEKLRGMHYIVNALEKYSCELFHVLMDPLGQAHEHRHPGLELFYAYWPAALPKDLAHQHVHKVFLTLFSEMVHRFLFRHREEPYRSCGVVSHEPTEEQFEQACDTPACCRRSSLALVQYSNVDSPGSTRFSRYKVAFSEWCLRVVPVTIPVEKMHAEQRNRSRKWSRKPVSFARQSCAEVVQHLQKLWTARGGRDLHILDAAYDKDLVAGKRSTGPAFARPKQTGNPSFSWITTQMTYRELCARCRV
jgi:hypothetical protein